MRLAVKPLNQVALDNPKRGLRGMIDRPHAPIGNNECSVFVYIEEATLIGQDSDPLALFKAQDLLVPHEMPQGNTGPTEVEMGRFYAGEVSRILKLVDLPRLDRSRKRIKSIRDGLLGPFGILVPNVSDQQRGEDDNAPRAVLLLLVFKHTDLQYTNRGSEVAD